MYKVLNKSYPRMDGERVLRRARSLVDPSQTS
jgi:hypothetical protein